MSDDGSQSDNAARRLDGPASVNGGLARMLRSLRWPVAVLWVLGSVLLLPLANGLVSVTNDTALAFLPAGAQSAQVARLQQEAQRASGDLVSQQAVVVFARPAGQTRGGLTPDDVAAVSAASPSPATSSPPPG